MKSSYQISLFYSSSSSSSFVNRSNYFYVYFDFLFGIECAALETLEHTIWTCINDSVGVNCTVDCTDDYILTILSNLTISVDKTLFTFGISKQTTILSAKHRTAQVRFSLFIYRLWITCILIKARIYYFLN